MNKKIHQIIRKHLYENEDAPAKAFKRFVNRIDNDYFDDIRRDTNTLSPDDTLQPALRKRVIDDFKKLVAERIDENLELTVMAEINSLVNEATPQEEINATISSLEANAKILRGFISRSHKYTEEDINKLYKNALRITPLEWLLSSNKKDVITFHHALQHDTIEKAEALIEESIADFMERIAQCMKVLLH